MKKVNSLYIEFEPVNHSQWKNLYSTVLNAMKENQFKMITWETGMTDIDYKHFEDNQIDIEDLINDPRN